jgi:hypothetical protein
MENKNNLSTLTHNRTTNLAQGKCNNIDFVIMFLGSNGPTQVTWIYSALAKFRNGFTSHNGQYGKCTYLFAREYGFISKSATDCEISLGNPGYAFGTNRTTYWYRVKRGVYALNENGLRRLANLK